MIENKTITLVRAIIFSAWGIVSVIASATEIAPLSPQIVIRGMSFVRDIHMHLVNKLLSHTPIARPNNVSKSTKRYRYQGTSAPTTVRILIHTSRKITPVSTVSTNHRKNLKFSSTISSTCSTKISFPIINPTTTIANGHET